MLLPNKQCFDSQSLYHHSISSGVKITQHGFLFFNSPIRMPTPSYPCPRTLGALCAYENYTFMPCTDQPLTRVTDAPPPFEQFWKNEAKCGKLPSMYDFHVTPCDLRKGTSIVWSDGMIAVQPEMDMDYWSSLITLLIMTWLIVNLGEAMALILEVEGTTPHNHNTVALCAVLVSIVAATTPQEVWATYDDYAIYCSTIVYIALYSVYHLSNPNTINVIVGCLILVSARFYQTNETPYVATFLFLIAARLVQKILRKNSTFSLARTAFMAMDIALFVMLYMLSFIPSCSQPTQAHLYLLGVLFSAACLGAFVANLGKAEEN